MHYYTRVQYNMYHKRPLDTQNAQPTPMPEAEGSEAKAVRPGAGRHSRA